MLLMPGFLKDTSERLVLGDAITEGILVVKLESNVARISPGRIVVLVGVRVGPVGGTVVSGKQ